MDGEQESLANCPEMRSFAFYMKVNLFSRSITPSRLPNVTSCPGDNASEPVSRCRTSLEAEIFLVRVLHGNEKIHADWMRCANEGETGPYEGGLHLCY